MVIRPATGTGNKVIVQDQAGAPVLTTADAGADLAMSVTGTGGIKSQQVFTSSGTWTKPAGITRIKVYVTGSGGGGGATNMDDMAPGGGAGATCIKIIDVTSISSVAVTVGAAKAGKANDSPTPHSAGNPSSFGSHCTAQGGYTPGDGWAVGGKGGTGSGGDINITGGDGQGGLIDNTGNHQAAGTGGASYWGSGGRGSTRLTTAARAGNAPGSGGGGGADTETGSNSAPGIVIVEEYR